MSKAFTREDDAAPEAPLRRPALLVPDPNPVTAEGIRALLAEAARGADPDRAREIADHLATAQTPPPPDPTIVSFGATVTLEAATGRRLRYRIVGAIESSPRDGAISFQSPVARSLLGARVGDTVALPSGELEVVGIE